MKGGTLFSGGGGFDIGMIAAGVDHAWGIEYDDRIAQVARDNGLNTITADILQCNPANLEPVDFLHASPPCPNFSNAKTNAEETDNDRALAAKVCEFITELLPCVFTLENVYQYRNSQSWETIARTLLTHGYALNYWHVNTADYGVPQTRKRMIAIARRDGRTPMLPPATHDEKPQAQLFGGRRQWVSWYEAIEDLIPTLPDSEFAPWQLERLPDDGNSKDGLVKQQGQPMATFRTMARAFVMNDSYPNGNETRKYRMSDEPIKTVTAIGKPIPAYTNGRIVKMTPRALARFQAFPDSYELPESNTLACRIIGNAVPPLFAQRLIEWLK